MSSDSSFNTDSKKVDQVVNAGKIDSQDNSQKSITQNFIINSFEAFETLKKQIIPNTSSLDKAQIELRRKEEKNNLEPYNPPRSNQKLSKLDQINVLKRLDTHRLLLITSPYEDLNIAALEYIKEEYAELQIVALNIASCKDDDVVSFAINQERESIDKRELVVIHLRNKHVTDLYSYLHKGSKQLFANKLKGQNRYLLLIYQMDTIQSVGEAFRAQFKSSIYCELDFVDVFLKSNFSASEVDYLKEMLIKQRKSGLWGSADQSQEFFVNLERAKSELKKDIEIKGSYDREKHGSPQSFIENFVSQVTVEEILPSEDSALKIVLFLATFFERMNLLEFKVLVEFLIDAKEINHIPSSAKNTESSSSKTTRRKKKNNEKLRRSPKEEWLEKRDQIFQEARLTIIQSSEQSEFVDFRNEYFRNDLKRHFQQLEPIYLVENFNLIKNSQLFLSNRGSFTLRKALIRFFALMASKYPDSFGYPYLFEIFEFFQQKNIQNLEALTHLSDKGDDTKEQFFAEHMEDVRNDVIRPLADLINEMLEYKHLQKVVSDFLEKLILIQGHSPFLDGPFLVSLLLQDVKGREVFHAEFDILKWVKRLLERSDYHKEYEHFYKLLLEVTESFPTEFFNILKSVASWKEESMKNSEVVNPVLFESSHRFHIDIFANQFSSSYLDGLGQYPPTHFLFASSYDDPVTFRENMECLCSGLLDSWLPIVKWNIKNQQNDPMTIEQAFWESQYFIAQIIEEWYLILRFRMKDQPESKKLTETLLNLIVEKAPRHQKKWFLSIWRRDKSGYLKLANEFKRDGKKETREWMRERRKCLEGLISEFLTMNKLHQNVK